MTEKQTQNKSKTEEKKQESNMMSTQNILAVILIISLLANAYLFIKLSENSSGTTTTTTIPTGVTGTTTPVTGNPAKDGDMVKVDYIGKFENGTLFDTSIKAEAEKAGMGNPLKTYEPLAVTIGAGQVIPGFENGLVGMKVGETKTITVPPGQGYDTGPLGGKTLVFIVTMRGITAKENIPTLPMVLVNDARCKECAQYAQSVTDQLKAIFPGLQITEYDYSTAQGKKIYADSNLKMLPAILFTDSVKTSSGYSNVANYLEQAGQYLSLKIGAQWDPSAETNCTNGVDDNGNGLIDCGDPSCAKDVICARTDKPVVEAFVMSHCPYGTQIEKGLLPVVNTLGDSIDFSVKFCSYAMHGEVEVKEQLTQYCIQKMDKKQYLKYLYCFLNTTGSDGTTCITSTGIDAAKLNACKAETDAKFNVTANFNDKSKWVSGQFPAVDLYKADNLKYDVQGSPTLIINGVNVENAGRNPQGLMDAICNAFTKRPDACSTNMSTATPSAGFGYNAADASASASGGCGV